MSSPSEIKYAGVNNSGLTEAAIAAFPVGTKITNGISIYQKFEHPVTKFWGEPWIWKLVECAEIHSRAKGHIHFLRPADWYEM